MSYSYKPVLISLVGISIISSTMISSGADELLSRAATQFRDKDYNAAYVLTEKSVESPQRSFLRGTAALRSDKPAEALPLLTEAEQKLPLVADYAALYQAEAYLKLKKYPEAAAKAASISKTYPTSRLLRRAEKLYADMLMESADYKTALKAFQAFVEKYPSGGDSVDAVYQTARCREELGNQIGAIQTYRNLWLNNPTATQAQLSSERIRELDKAGFKNVPYSADELLKRASHQYSHNEYRESLKTLDSIEQKEQPKEIVYRIELKTGMALYRLRQYKQSEKHFATASASKLAGVNSESRFWMGKALERQGQNESALVIYAELAAKGKKQEYSDDAMMEAAGLKRNLGQYTAAAQLYQQVIKLYPDSKFVSKAVWEAGWCSYLSADYPAAVESFKGLLKDESVREKALYWLGRSLENIGNAESASWYRMLLDEYPSGFYATWFREQKKQKDTRESLGDRNALAELPLLGGFEKPRLLASLGLAEEARGEMLAARKKVGDKKGSVPGLARIYLEMKEYSSAIYLFMQNRPVPWEKSTLPFWTAGYPLAFTDLVHQNSVENGLSEGLVYALIRAESGFTPAIKSGAGAIGLMQMMPATAKQTSQEKGSFNPQNLTLPEYNIKLGTKHLRDLMKLHDGDVVSVAAAYNAGSGALGRWKNNFKGLKKDEFIESIPYQETREYVKKVYASAATYRQLYGLK